MFLEQTLRRNEPLVELAFALQQSGAILPDTFLLDLDAIEENAEAILSAARRDHVSLYFMLKQLGRNPLVAQALGRMDFSGAVCVDFREALHLLAHHIPLGNVGHLVQTPKAALRAILEGAPDVMTVYTLEKAAEIGAVCRELGRTQGLLLRVVDQGDYLFPGQSGGFPLAGLEETARAIGEIPGVTVAGVCAFPCLSYDAQADDILPTASCATLRRAAQVLEGCGYQDLQLNMPSATCVRSIPRIAQEGGTHGEPGHGLTGTTPYHATHEDAPERPAMVYVTEVSHNFGGKGYCYGGGFYRRGQLSHALVGRSLAGARMMDAKGVPPESIDYHLELGEECAVSDGVVMSFRSQIFVTRSEVAVVRGLSQGAPRVEGIYSSLGQRLR